MINNYLLNPGSIVVVGGSEDISKPGGKVLKNILDGDFRGELSVVNPKAAEKVQGVKAYGSPADIPDTDLAIIAVAAKYCKDTVEILTHRKKTRAFIILSAGFGEENDEGAKLEKEIVDIINSVDGCLIGPNCIGVLNQSYSGVFTTPIPELDPLGVDFISGSGATAVFIMESAIPNGIRFSSVFSVGNSAQTGVEEVLKYLDETYEPGKSSPVKLLYIESISKPDMLLKHASSLISKGCRVAAIKSGSSAAGSRAASSHTGAMANPDVAVDALFRKAGIIRCYGRHELAAVAAVLMSPRPEGRRMAIITHAGGPAVMMTDELSKGGIEIPALKGEKADALLEKLYPGSSVANPVDFLATGNAEQLAAIIDACENDFDEIDAMAVIFGSPGLFPVDDVYKVLHDKIRSCQKPVYPVLPSLITAGREVSDFIDKGNINFPDEVVFASALSRVLNTAKPAAESAEQSKPAAESAEQSKPAAESTEQSEPDIRLIRQVIDNNESGYLSPGDVQSLLDAAGIERVEEALAYTEEEAADKAADLGFPVVMKVVGPVHKSDVGGVVLNIDGPEKARTEFRRLMKIDKVEAVLMQPMISGVELFAGAVSEPGFGHLVMAGLGGIFIEVLKDVNTALVPVSEGEAGEMIRTLKGFKMLEGLRGQAGVNIKAFTDVLLRLSALLQAAPEISELDLNPLMGSPEAVRAVDSRIKIAK
ncbi:MAG: acetate--CoA ligase family protein [Bacteroidales bacterium]|nr:acetate--CoA ligase family protein [Bacteroidales bacterium]